MRVLAEESKLLANRKRQQHVHKQVLQLEEELAQLKAEEAELVRAQASASAEPAPGAELHARLRRLAEVCPLLEFGLGVRAHVPVLIPRAPSACVRGSCSCRAGRRATSSSARRRPQ